MGPLQIYIRNNCSLTPFFRTYFVSNVVLLVSIGFVLVAIPYFVRV
jgi:hypothetical protein